MSERAILLITCAGMALFSLVVLGFFYDPFAAVWGGMAVLATFFFCIILEVGHELE